jgi:tetratricopeptide (TPR) repeat protein
MLFVIFIFIIILFLIVKFGDRDLDRALAKTDENRKKYPELYRSKFKLRKRLSEQLVMENGEYYFKDNAGAIETLCKILLLESSDQEALTQRGACLAKINLYLNAIDDFEDALVLRSNGNTYGLLGLIYFKIGHLDKARLNYQKAIMLGANNYQAPLTLLNTLSKEALLLIEEKNRIPENLKKWDIYAYFSSMPGSFFENFEDEDEFNTALEQRLDQLRLELASQPTDIFLIDEIEEIIAEMKRIGPVNEATGKFDWVS